MDAGRRSETDQAPGTDTPPLRIEVDDREPSEMVDILRGTEGVEIAVRRLKRGDYLVDGWILFERKRLDDFFASIKNGRLFSQACALAGGNCRAAIILEGGYGDIGASGMRREAVQGAIVSVSMMLGLPILRSLDMTETARLIVYTARQSVRAPRGAFYRHGYRPKGLRRRKLFVLQGLPGVGPERAARLLDHFGSLEAVFQAGEDELAQVRGIAYPTAKRIRNLIREIRSGYGGADSRP
jgi:DNA excision repair protein ERCC-4